MYASNNYKDCKQCWVDTKEMILDTIECNCQIFSADTLNHLKPSIIEQLLPILELTVL
jgi:hypothetical protein